MGAGHFTRPLSCLRVSTDVEKGREEQKLGIKEEDGREEIKGHNI